MYPAVLSSRCRPAAWIIHHIHFKKRMALCINDLDGFHKFHEQHGVVQQKGVAPPGLVLFYSLPTASLSLRGGLDQFQNRYV